MGYYLNNLGLLSIIEGFDSSKKADIVHGIKVIRNSLIVGSCVCLVGLVLDDLLSTFIYLMILISVRSISGGFHMKTIGRCALVTPMLCLMTIIVGAMLHQNQSFATLVFMGIISSFILFLYGEGHGSGTNISEEKRQSNRMNSFYRSGIWHIICLCGCLYIKDHKVFYCIEVALLLVALCTVHIKGRYLLNPFNL